MEKFSEYSHIAKLISLKYLGVITVEEMKELDEWLDQDPSHIIICEKIEERLQKEDFRKSYRYKPSIQSDWKEVKAKVKQKDSKSLILGRWLQYAAITLLFISVSVGIIYKNTSRNEINNNILHTSEKESILPGSPKAVLTLANGEKVLLENLVDNSIEEEGIMIEKKEGELSYKDALKNKEEEKEIYNTITIPVGGEFKLTLSDGTQVWLNSCSELKYPVKFVGHNREVYINGEAYFEVAENREKPFIVYTYNDLKVTVLGTKFNISAYEEAEFIATTLAQGKVKVSNRDESLILEPNQQAILEKESEYLTKKEVDAYYYISWKDGKFLFEEESLENIMERLCRWYNIEVYFENKNLKTLRFSGDLKRYEDFSTVMGMLEKVSNIKIEIVNQKIIIKEQ